MANRQPDLDPKVLTIADLLVEGQKNVTFASKEYFNGGAGEMITVRDNEDAYNRYKLRPRVLRDVDGVDMTTTIFGVQVAAPLGFAPSAAHKLAHPDGELATSRAAAKNNIPMCLSSYASVALEEVKAAGGSNPHAMQITFVRDLEATKEQISRAERAGYHAIFVSVDLPILGRRLNESRNNFSFPAGLEFPNIRSRPTESDTNGLITTSSLDYGNLDPSITWEKAIPWLRAQTKMEIWLKGIYTPEDVAMAISHGLDGIIISNHGGRQLDGVPATLDALRDCAPVAEGKIAIAIDGGIRRGADLFKAIALGAQFCFIGRVVIWGLAYNGEKGVDLAVKILLDELRQTMMLCGCHSIRDITKSHLSVLQRNGRLSKL
ncbi:uncharacterized protein Z519_10606 [Cladophialophora bantiana CBS 173.52]|uniref:Oxidase FUB9 n=1 Tax=Cladophialophora bantiana (strain ATCC 10958 / CBS 173.52 / CDC B-1940 / NIH 8579) TaxID=1442370 RepID=A0A0D2HCE2_CLAB1|nr:uncharacterized protein Z519_10606 [Cladophialophora bantiana CBS 173.52]KIW88560.1 hypothetical protein Z519_10606 [Cladophialophora bantiana CBS 173.52]